MNVVLVVLSLLAHDLDKVKLDLASCDYFGANDRKECASRMDRKNLARIVARARQCASHGHCERKTELSTETIDVACAGDVCTLRDHWSNDDEDTDYRYVFKRTLADHVVRFSFSQNN